MQRSPASHHYIDRDLFCSRGAFGGDKPLTKDKIAQQEEQAASEARELVLPGVEEFEEMEATDADGESVVYYVGKEGGEVAGYVFTTSASSYGGPVQVMTGIRADGEVSGVQLLSINDTPGLGMNAKRGIPCAVPTANPGIRSI